MKDRYKMNAYNSLTENQIHFIRSNLDKMKRSDIAKKLNIPEVRLKRAASFKKWRFTSLKYSDEIKKEVCDYFNQHGLKKTAEKFPEVRIRSIVERNKKYRIARQKRWTENQIIQLAKFAGIINIKDQVKYFNRPLAKEQSIPRAWKRIFGISQMLINGLYYNKAKYIVNKNCPSINVSFLGDNNCYLYLWIDIKKNIKKDLPNYIVKAIDACALFQNWIWGGGDVKRKILKMIKEIEKR